MNSKVMLIVLMCSIAICDVAISMVFQLHPLMLDAGGYSALYIGAVVAMGPLGQICAAAWTPRFVALYGMRTSATLTVGVLIACVFLFTFLPPDVWFAIRFVFGAATGALTAFGESWVIFLSPAASRGRVLAIYSCILSLTFGLGPLIVGLTGIDGYAPWITCLALLVAGILPFCLMPAHDGGRERDEATGVFALIRRQPIIFACALAATLFDAILVSFFALYAMEKGIGAEEATLLLGGAVLASIVFYYPLGLMADSHSPDKIILICVVAVILCGILLPWTIQTQLRWVVMLGLCAGGFGLYVATLAAIGSIFHDGEVVSASSAVTLAWGVGGIIGPILAGWSMSLSPDFFPLLLTIIHLVLFGLMATQGFRVVRS